MRLLFANPVVPLLAVTVFLCSCHQQAAVDPNREAQTERSFELARQRGPGDLRAFLLDMPKGADLHVHLSGAIYAETFLKDAAEDGLCIDIKTLSFVKPAGKVCVAYPKSGLTADPAVFDPTRPSQVQISAADLLAHTQSSADQSLYDKLVNAFSMRSFVPYAEWSGHDQFFSTFDRFSGLNKSHTGEWLDEVATRAAAQNEQYLELMITPPFGHAATVAYQLGWDPNLPEFRQKLLDDGAAQEVVDARSLVQTALAQRNQLEQCGTPQAQPACQVQIRFIYQILRGFPRQQVFAQTLLGFEAISKIPEFVGINFVQPEDGHISMTDYTLQMQMLNYLHSVYPAVHISLHAGELAPGMVPPDGLLSHIRQAVEIGHAERIGHGVDVMHESNAPQLLRELAQQHIMIEINLTSNDGILEIKEDEHPLPDYRRAHVPVALSTDDEGVSRIDLTHEYVRAAEDFSLSYIDLKQMARTGMEHNFLPGKSLWAKPDIFKATVSDCSSQLLGGDTPTSTCNTYLNQNPKAAAQWEQERRFRVFEAKW